MKRFHIHLAVENLANSIGFYSTLFGAEPTVVKPDYAKWMLDDPRLNFAVSQRGEKPGLNHLGVQVESTVELDEMHSRLDRLQTGAVVVAEEGAACCYAKSDKYWATDPEGIAWEAFHTLSDIPMFGSDPGTAVDSTSCCVPGEAVNEKEAAPCCGAAKEREVRGRAGQAIGAGGCC